MYISKICSGRPTESRGPREEFSYRTLDKLGIEYTRIDHDTVNTMEACEEIDRLMGVTACKNLFLCNKNKNRYFLVVLCGDKRFDAKRLSKQLGLPRLSFGHEEQMEELLGVSPGSVSILGIANDTCGKVTLILDSDILKHEHFGCHPCVNTSSLKIKTRDILEKFIPYSGHEPIFYTP